MPITRKRVAKRKAVQINTPEDPIVNLPCEILTEILSCLPDESTEVRLVCRGFRNCAWPAFGSRISRTKFDMRSIKSMDNLKAISEHAVLVAHVTKLAFTVGHLSSLVPGTQEMLVYDSEDSDCKASIQMTEVEPEEYLDAELLGGVECFRRHQTYWFAEAWRWCPCMDYMTDTLAVYAAKTQKQGVVNFLAETLSKFDHLHSIEYRELMYPEKFMPLWREIMEAMNYIGIKFARPYSPDEAAMDINGIDILLNALVAGDVVVKDLSMGIPAMYCHSIATYTDPTVLQKVLRNVETLKALPLLDAHFSHHLGKDFELVLTSQNAPKLQELTLVGWVADPGSSHDIPSWMSRETVPNSELAPLRVLKLGHSHGKMIDHHFFDFLSAVGSTLRVLTVDIGFQLDWKQLIEFLVTSVVVSLDKLKITGPKISNPKNSPCDVRAVPPKELLYQAAQDVVVAPKKFDEWLQSKWLPKTPAGRIKVTVKKRLKARSK
ncbi:hypothetical protein CC78DRAFT_618067 [Lojkania enalia]|uniref:F-box domain-containing protein n=1 Tax=Lojkania enalia TaxID=147567 RepID=A0A9P4N7U6_9PLEO|nr:hypothetical protein CC78DRAFT_618067 [Didymosphaeria enalia]